MADNSVSYADIIILALIAGFILLRLRSVLGQKMGNDNPDFLKDYSNTRESREPVVHVDEKSLKPKTKEEPDIFLAKVSDNSIRETLETIREKDPQFSATTFLAGAKMAFEMVFDAFAKGDRQTLKMLLADPIYQDFSGEIDEREKSDRRSETTLVSVRPADITGARLEKNVARLTVKFVSEQVTVVRDESGKIIEGDASEVHEVEDEWTFEREVTSKNPNWKIIET